TMSVVESILRTDPADVYGDQDFATRDTYRAGVEQIARHCELSEKSIAGLAISRAAESPADMPRKRHVGYWLVGDGRRELEDAVRLRPGVAGRFWRMGRAIPLTWFAGGVALATLSVWA